MSTLNVGTIKSVTANVPPLFQDSGGTTRGQLCRASIRFNQQGTQTINQSYNVSSITDNGTGFEKFNDNIKDALNPYISTKKNGTGLGLSIVNKIVNDHNGKIELMSVKEGAKIKIIFIK